MNRSTSTLAIALAALALAGPALAQSGVQSGVQSGPSSNTPDPAVREMQRARGNPAAVPYIPAQDRNAATADAIDVQTARGLMAEARAALVRRRAGMAVEALERAESRLLTNSVLASQANVPQSSAALSQLAAARRLAGQGDTRSALQALDRAEAALPATPTGPGATPLPEGVPTAIDVQPPVPPAVQPRPVRPRPAPPAPALPGEAVPPRG